MDVSDGKETPEVVETIENAAEAITEAITEAASNPLKAGIVLLLLFGLVIGAVMLYRLGQRRAFPKLTQPAPEEPEIYNGCVGGGPI
jgi:hypothetical protein